MIQQVQVVIVGGRVAGAALAIRLGELGIRTLVVERGEVPSLPAVSCPIIFAPTMTLLDDLGLDEARYASNTPPIRKFAFEGEDIFSVQHPIPLKDSHNYAYAIDRKRFDAALWDRASAYDCVELRQQTSVTKLQFEGKRVVGVTVRHNDSGKTEDVSCDLVVGADGRFSFTAKAVKAKNNEFQTRFHTSAYYAYWQNVEPFDSDEGAFIHLFRSTGRYGVLLLDSADGTTSVLVEGHPKLFEQKSSPTDIYHQILHSHPALQRRIRHAEPVTSVRGMRRIRPIYRQGGGPGWALVGDAIHQKDPLDGQGIYNTLFSVNLLADAIQKFYAGANWPHLMAHYERAIRQETEPMLRVTLQRIAREIYGVYPVWFGQTFGRWIFTNEDYLDGWIRLMIRDISPDDWFPPSQIANGIVKGIAGDLFGTISR